MSTEDFNKKDNLFLAEEESSFDIKEWLFHFLSYWYVFVFGIFIALGASYLKNRTWMAQYETSGTMVIEENTSRGFGAQQAIMQGFGVQSGYRNINNQVIMLQSYDLLTRVVDSLSFMKVEYITQGRFKTRNIYKNTPIYIEPQFLSPEAYEFMYKINLKSDGTYVISIEDDKQYSNYKIEGAFGELLQSELFNVTIHDLRIMASNNTEMYFKFRSREDLVNEFFYRLRFAYVMEGSSILRVSLNGETPDRDVDFINKLCELFIEDNLMLKNDAATKTIKFIDEQLAILSHSLTLSEDKMTKFRQENQIVDVSSYVSEILRKATLYDNKKKELELREYYLDYLTDYLQTNLEAGTVVAPSAFGLNEPMLMQLVQQINELYIERSELSDKNFYYSRVTKEIESLKTVVFEVVSNMRLALNIEKKEVEQNLEGIEEEIKVLPNKELEMIAIERNYRVDDNYYTFFLQKRAESQIQKESNSPDNSVLDKARVMAITNGSAKSRTVIIYLLLGLLIPGVFVMLIKLLNNKINSEKDIEKLTSFPVIGSIRRTRSKDPMLSIKKPRSSFAEMFRLIRTRIEFIVQRKSNILITITSAESGDGKTYFSANLAAVYSMTERKTLLIDMDVRKPNIYELFDIPNEPGLTNYLIGEEKLSDIIQKTDNEYYDILTVGPVPPNPGEIVRSEKLKALFEELKKHYDYIIVDTSPIGLVADAYSIMLLSDVSLFVTRLEKTNKHNVKRITTQLKEDNVPNIYIVLNDISTDKNRYTKYYSYGGYGGYGYGSKYYHSKKQRKALENYSKYYTDDKDI
ncbi:polysaccharide biosynthesis tyrosine autokinase [Paludibacter sp. 221]|uniref:polysaccharide biosynthesis tyrosine autokinase n=1 Tax=Paludibacter sp. 221 TaxID=2302939 RepID=UPI0013D196B0|nr:tyrosine-protein kinase family protein [Paludibacter sp. 221]NDV46204.1 polysaccharide biosynthesis tyrosine autokinase [Paludibacter sp. 221]